MPARAGEEVDAERLAAWLKGNGGGPEGPVEVEQFPNGHSNLVYLVRWAGREYVLRRPPVGPVAPKAHDMAREYRVLEAVQPHFPEAPRVLLLCGDAEVLGAPFFLMERRHGVVLRTEAPGEWAADPDFPRRTGEAVADCLARLHAVDVRAGKLPELGRPGGFVERQVRGWAERWQAAKTEEVPEMDRVIRFLQEKLPPQLDAVLVHNDFKLDNLMLSGGGGTVTAVLDWEMATLGDPLADLGLTLCYWTWAAVASAGDPHPATPVITTGPGWPTRDEFAERYARRTGRDLTHLPYHEVLGIFKLAVILQQIYFRYRRGQTRDERFRGFDRRVRGLAALADGMAGRLSGGAGR